MADSTRSKSQPKTQPDLSISVGIQEYFENLVKNLATIESLKPLATNDGINDLLNKFEEKISAKFELNSTNKKNELRNWSRP